MLTANGIFPLNILLGYVPCNKLRSITLKLEIKLAGVIVKGVIGDILRVRVKLGVLSTKYKELIYKEV